MRTAIFLFLTLASFRAFADDMPARASRGGIVASEVHPAPIIEAAPGAGNVSDRALALGVDPTSTD